MDEILQRYPSRLLFQCLTHALQQRRVSYIAICHAAQQSWPGPSGKTSCQAKDALGPASGWEVKSVYDHIICSASGSLNFQGTEFIPTVSLLLKRTHI